ncbi:efflux RND transporter permease subunit [Shigella sonnei]
MANFFIDRPIFAWVLAILLCLTGTLAIFSLPVEQYPDLAPPNVRVTANYPGASAQTLENTVTQVIEQNMTGLDNLMYMSSQSSGIGQASVTLSFKAGTDPDEAVQQVQNQLQSAMRKLPQAVQNQGVTVRKTGDTNILTIAFVSTDGSMDKQDIADYVASNIQDPLSRVNGVGDIDAYGSQYSMRIWLDPAKLNSFQMTAKDVTDAIESQNAQIAVGQLGGTPSVDKQALNATINAQSLLQTPEQFRDITLRVNQDGSEVRLGDVATVEMGAEKYDYLSRFNGKPASGLGVKLASGANEMATAELVLNRLDELAQYFPHGLEYKVAYETTSFVKASIGLPTSFLPLEDRGMFTTSVQLPSGSTQQQTLKVVEQIEKYYFTHEKDNIMSVFATVGSGPGGNGQNVARMFIRLKDWSERDSKTGTSFAIIERATKAFNKIKEARVIASSPPAISGLGSSAGFDMELQDHAGAGHDALMAARNQLLALAAENPELTRVRHNGLDDSPQLQIDIDQRKAQALGVAIDDINDTLQTAWGSSYVNDFMDRGRVKKVYVQAAAPYRMLPDDINLWYVRNKDGGMVPFSAFATSRWETGSPRLERYNGYSAVEIVGEAAPGVSTGTAMDIMESLVKQLPNGFGLEWTAMSYQERLSGAQAPALYAISLLVVFLCLAALYESWSVPFSVMLVVPLGVIGALLATWMRGLENDVYFQVGLLTVIGLSAKNAILIVEFANEMNQKGHDLFEATLHACRQRLRPILMTSLAFIFGVLPMATSTGAGSGGQHAVGTGVMGGMISATILAIYFVPLFFVLVRRRFPLKPRPE